MWCRAWRRKPTTCLWKTSIQSINQALAIVFCCTCTIYHDNLHGNATTPVLSFLWSLPEHNSATGRSQESQKLFMWQEGVDAELNLPKATGTCFWDWPTSDRDNFGDVITLPLRVASRVGWIGGYHKPSDSRTDGISVRLSSRTVLLG